MKYTEQKQNNLVELVKIGGGVAMSKKRFNADTGSEETPEIISVDLDELTAKKAKLEEEIADIDLLIVDINKLNK